MPYRVLAALVAPLVLALLFVATTPAGFWVPVATQWFGYYVLAHFLFWPPYFLTMYLGRRLRVTTAIQLALLMGLCSLALVICVAVAPREIVIENYHWRDAALDCFPESIAAAGAFLLYQALRSLDRRPGASGRT
jgi:ABC-type transport system involved in multi-copper enzyme maturation permease subunit